jgi:hypothetical protein
MSSETQFAMSRDRDQTQRGTVAQAMAADVLLLEAHRTCRPYAVKEKQDGTIIDAPPGFAPGHIVNPLGKSPSEDFMRDCKAF